jgi:hypothetical protein
MTGRGEKTFFGRTKNMTHGPELEGRPRTTRRDPKTAHNWRLPAGSVAERVIDNLEGQLEDARDELVNDFHRAAHRRGCSHFVGAPGDPLSAMFTVYDEKIDRAVSDLRRALR